MNMAQKIVTQTPLTELWNTDGPLDAHRAEQLGETDITRLLRDGSSLLVADVGLPLRWISDSDGFSFWKTEVKCRLVAADANGFYPNDYPGNYCYVATMWECVSSPPIIVLEKHH